MVIDLSSRDKEKCGLLFGGIFWDEVVFYWDNEVELKCSARTFDSFVIIIHLKWDHGKIGQCRLIVHRSACYSTADLVNACYFCCIQRIDRGNLRQLRFLSWRILL